MTARTLTTGTPPLPPTARDVFGADLTAEQATSFNRARVATCTALALYRSGQELTRLSDDDIDTAVRALKFPSSRPSEETRAAIRAALAVLETDPTISII
ncbi:MULTISPECIES: hypothetical protein [Streptomyces]|uniref:Uncharacterized protein n=1 Tax=Streptomyces galilaeus TaxID=33899 RepID=A0ABW9ITE7_STRGJ|nr:hypothetical protein [Streptomyces galilaeus]